MKFKNPLTKLTIMELVTLFALGLSVAIGLAYYPITTLTAMGTIFSGISLYRAWF